MTHTGKMPWPGLVSWTEKSGADPISSKKTKIYTCVFVGLRSFVRRTAQRYTLNFVEYYLVKGSDLALPDGRMQWEVASYNNYLSWLRSNKSHRKEEKYICICFL